VKKKMDEYCNTKTTAAWSFQATLGESMRIDGAADNFGSSFLKRAALHGAF
jgi:hypothetical protein